MPTCASCSAHLRANEAFVEWLEGEDDDGPRGVRVYCMNCVTNGERSPCARYVGMADAKYVSFTSSNRPSSPQDLRL